MDIAKNAKSCDCLHRVIAKFLIGFKSKRDISPTIQLNMALSSRKYLRIVVTALFQVSTAYWKSPNTFKSCFIELSHVVIDTKLCDEIHNIFLLCRLDTIDIVHDCRLEAIPFFPTFQHRMCTEIAMIACLES